MVGRDMSEPTSPMDETNLYPSTSHAPDADADADADADDEGRRSSTATSRLRRASTRIIDSNPPSGMWHATGHVISKAPTVKDIRHGRFSHGGWSVEGQRTRSYTGSTSESPTTVTTPAAVDVPRSILEVSTERERELGAGRPGVADDPKVDHHHHHLPQFLHRHPNRTVDTEKVMAETMGHEMVGLEVRDTEKAAATAAVPLGPGGVYANGYQPPPKHTWGQATTIACKGFWRFVTTPSGFLITLYGLNVVAWGGMLFLVLLKAAPAMCHPSCDDLTSPRKKWIEIDSQILNALFCVTGLGLIPWRFRDLYYLLKWRLGNQVDALRILAGIHRGWFRLSGSDRLLVNPGVNGPGGIDEVDNPALPIPASKAPDIPLTGFRAPPTRPWKLDFVIWMYVWNTFFQIILCGFMWALNRFNRPGWSTGTFVALACIVAAAAGVMIFVEGKRIKKIEGVPVSEDDLAIFKDMEQGRS